MLRSILVGLDGSDDGAAAVDVGIDWAKRFNALLVALGVVDEPAIRGSEPTKGMSPSYQPVYEQLLKEDRHRVEQTLSQFAVRCSEEQVPFKLLEDEGQPAERVTFESQRYDLLILGCRTHFTHGSERRPCKTLETILRNTPRPVVAVPKALRSYSDGGILVAYDGGVQAARALQVFLATGLHRLGPVQIITIHPDSRREAARVADHAAEFLRFHDIQAKPSPLVSRSPAGKLLLEKAGEDNASIIVMGAHGQPKLTEFFFGSTTRTALKESPVPLFLYH